MTCIISIYVFYGNVSTISLHLGSDVVFWLAMQMETKSLRSSSCKPRLIATYFIILKNQHCMSHLLLYWTFVLSNTHPKCESHVTLLCFKCDYGTFYGCLIELRVIRRVVARLGPASAPIRQHEAPRISTTDNSCILC